MKVELIQSIEQYIPVLYSESEKNISSVVMSNHG